LALALARLRRELILELSQKSCHFGGAKRPAYQGKSLVEKVVYMLVHSTADGRGKL